MEKKKRANGLEQVQEVQTSNREVSEVERYIPVAIPEIYNINSEFNNILIQS
jgi:hypothetical protein